MSSSDLSILSNETIQAALKQTIEDKLKTTEYETTIGPACKKGDNFLGVVYRITCKKTIREEQGESPSELNLILKVAPYHPERREVSPSRRYFMREMYLFDEVRISNFYSLLIERRNISNNSDPNQLNFFTAGISIFP